MKAIPRPLEHLQAISKVYPSAWKQVEVFRQGRGVDLPMWPDWCFMPMAAWYSIVSADAGVDRLPVHLVADVSRLAAIGAWRYTQGIYRIDPDLFAAVATTIPGGPLPCDVLLRMPEWSLYIETPSQQWLGNRLYGFWAHLEWDTNTQRYELRLLLDTESNLIPMPLHLGDWTITEAVDRAVSEAKMQGSLIGLTPDFPGDFIETVSESLYALVSLVLYVCSNGVEYNDYQSPDNPAPKRTKRGWRLFPASKPRIWSLGKTAGEVIRKTERDLKDRKGPAGHIRRAHWHGYWKGPKEKQEFFLKWLPLTVVGDNEQ